MATQYLTPKGAAVGIGIGLLLFLGGQRYWPGAFTVWALVALT